MSPFEPTIQLQEKPHRSVLAQTDAPAAQVAEFLRSHRVACISVATALCFALRLMYLGRKSLWIDEIWSLRIAQLPWHSLGWELRNQDPNSGLYYSLLHLWLHFGHTEVAIRSLSVLFATATVPVLYLLGKRMIGPLAGLTASLLIALNIFHIQWSQETRGYTILVFAVTLSTLLFVRSIESPSFMNWAGYSLVGVLAVYVHLFAALVFVAHWVSLLFLRPRSVPWRGFLASNLSIGLLSIPLLALIHARAKSPFVPLDWIPLPGSHAVYDAFYQLAGNANFPDSAGGKPLVALYLILCLVAFVSLCKTAARNRRSFELWHLGLMFCWLILPVAAIFGMSLRQPIYVSRYLLVSLPAMMLLGASGMVRIRPRLLAAATMILAILFATAGLPRYYRYRANFLEWNAVTTGVLARTQPGDGIIFCVAPGRLLFDYYAAKADADSSAVPQAVYPDFQGFNSDPRALDYLPAWDDDQIRKATAEHPRMWFVVYHDFFGTTERARDRFKAILNKAYLQSSVERINGVTVNLYFQPASAQSMRAAKVK